MWIQREISRTIRELSRQMPVLIVSGCRQTGKTSLLRHEFSNNQLVALDLPIQAEQAEESGEQFLDSYPPPLIIDEIQYAPKLLRHIKHRIDLNRNLEGQYLLTGSQKFSLMANVTESLAGRAALLDLHSLSLSELESWSGKKAEKEQLLMWMLQGGYPELHVKGLSPERFYSNYVSTYLERDVRQVLQVRNLRDFARFMRLAATRTGQLLSMNSFASDLGLSPNTVKTWFSVLESSNIILLLEPYYRNLGKRIVKSPKLYFLDTGLACYLAGFRTTQELKNSELLGAFFETLALGQLIRRFHNEGKQSSIYFYRDHYGNEVDFVIPVGEKLKLIECKWSETPSGVVKGFLEIEKLIGKNNILNQCMITPVRDQKRTLSGGSAVTDDLVELSILRN